MNLLLAIPLEVRLLLLALAGAALGGQLNRAIYRLAWQARQIGPWTPPAAGAPPRRAGDRVPIVGWLGLRREAALHGRAFWLRPLLIELVCTLGIPALYWYELQGGLVPQVPAAAAPTVLTLHLQFLSHLILLSLLTVATFIDFDEQTIPDEITVTGTLGGLLLLALLPAMQPVIPVRTMAGVGAEHLVFTSPQTSLQWADGLGGPGSWPLPMNGPRGLAWGLAGYLAWCLAILPKCCTLRRGVWKGLVYMVASVLRGRGSPIVLGLAIVGSLLIVGTWLWGGRHWESLLTSVVGLAFAGGLIWAVRIVGGLALRREAMGFGDVTLMAMIGTYVGWQPSLVIFFLAPFAALVVSLVQVVLTGRRDIAFGPYLSVATVMLLILWPQLWPGYAASAFSLGGLIPLLVGACLLLMGGMLSCWRLLGEALERLGGQREQHRGRDQQRQGERSTKRR